MNTSNSPHGAHCAALFAAVVLLAGCRDDGATATQAIGQPLAVAPAVAPTANGGSTTGSANGWEPLPPPNVKGGTTPRVTIYTGPGGIEVLRAGTPYSNTAPSNGIAGGNFYTADNLPPWATLNAYTGEISGTPLQDDVGDYPRITVRTWQGNSVVGVRTLRPMLVAPEPLGANNFSPQGDVFPMPNGYQSVGDLELDAGGFAQSFDNADLVLEFDEDGNLLDLFGDGDLPTELSENVSVDAGIRTVVGLMTGAEINADEAFGITLVDELSYMVFLLDAGLDITIGDPNDPGAFSSITLDTPAAGQIVLISDPTDTFFYRFGAQALIGEYGEGTSTNGLIPFIPELDHPALDTFSGHKIEKGAMGIGFKVFDFFNVSGTRVTKQPQFADIDWDDPLDSAIEYRSGINGYFDFAFGVLSVGLFEFELAQGSATLDVGFDRQQAAIALRIAPDVSWVPSWFPFVPTTEFEGAAFINGDTDFELSLAGTFQSTVPPADVGGSIVIDNDSTTLTGKTKNDGDELSVSIEFADNVTTGRVRFPAVYAQSINDDVLAALDRELAALEDAIQELTDAVADYQFEVSLRGFRDAIPPLVDSIVSMLNAVPGSVYNAARSNALSVMANTCTTVIVTEYCLEDVVNETSIANSIASTARSNAQSGVAPYISTLQTLKTRALEGDDESLRDALYQALDQAQARHTYSQRIRVTYSFPWPFDRSYTLYDQTVTRTVLTTSQRNQIITARDNVWRIQATSDIMVSAQTVVDQLPTEEVIATVRQEVADGLAQVPIPDGLGYRVVSDVYEPFIIAGGQEYDIGFNVLSSSAVRDGVSDWIADNLLGGN